MLTNYSGWLLGFVVQLLALSTSTLIGVVVGIVVAKHDEISDWPTRPLVIFAVTCTVLLSALTAFLAKPKNS